MAAARLHTEISITVTSTKIRVSQPSARKNYLKKKVNFYTPVALRSLEPAGCTFSAVGCLRLLVAAST